MEDNHLKQQIRFLLELDQLKQITRRNYITGGPERRENSAEHSWHLAIMAMVLNEYADDPVNLVHVIKLALVHDIVEIDAGDTYCYDEIGALDKTERERRAADRIFSLLPPDQADNIRELWEEFEAGITPESKFAGALDCLMPLLHNYHTTGKSWIEHGITKDQVIARVSRIRDASDRLWGLACSVIEKAVEKGYLRDG